MLMVIKYVLYRYIYIYIYIYYHIPGSDGIFAHARRAMCSNVQYDNICIYTYIYIYIRIYTYIYDLFTGRFIG